MKSLKFKNQTHNRYWWHKLSDTDYVPDIYKLLSDDEWNLLESWFKETEEKFSGTGEMQIPGISLICSLINGNGISRIIQCGHYIGYSTLLLAFMFKRMNKNKCIFSVDIDLNITEYTQAWINKADLNNQVILHVEDSADKNLPKLAKEYFGGKNPQLILIDSSHQYEHTIKELNLWWDILPKGGFIIMHDVSVFASEFDKTNSGGVNKAINSWLHDKNYNFLTINGFVDNTYGGNDLTYKDGCGLGIIQK